MGNIHITAEVDVNLSPHYHIVAALLKRWLLGTHQGAVSYVHLDYYPDEFTFRFNRWTSRHRIQLLINDKNLKKSRTIEL